MKEKLLFNMSYITEECQGQIKTVLKGLGAETEDVPEKYAIYIINPTIAVKTFLNLMYTCDCGYVIPKEDEEEFLSDNYC